MKFMVMHKQTAEMEKGLKPDPEVIKNVHDLIGDAVKQKVFQGGEGLHPTSTRTRLLFAAAIWAGLALRDDRVRGPFPARGPGLR